MPCPGRTRINSKSSSSVVHDCHNNLQHTEQRQEHIRGPVNQSQESYPDSIRIVPGALLSESLDRAQNSGPGRPVRNPSVSLPYP